MTEPLCPYFGFCGGCSLQNVDYPSQVARKRDELAAVSGLSEIPVFSGREYGYRSRMDFAFHPAGLGFRRRGSWREFFDVESCPISNERINGLLAELRDFFRKVDSFDPATSSGTFRYAVVRAPEGDSSVSFVVNEASPRVGDALLRVREFADVTSASNVAVAYLDPRHDASLSGKYDTLKGSDMLCETYFGRRFQYPVQGFFQNNPEVALKMHSWVRGLFTGRGTGGSHLLDLYGGVGTFGILNCDLFGSVTVLESDGRSIDAAAANAAFNKVENVSALALDARRLREVELGRPLFVVTDPPRGGMHPKTVKRLTELAPESIVYVSCNLKQLAADLPRLGGYIVGSASLFDMFPQTPHIEAIFELTRA
jgi:tRNA/tmRNA/rRNA uracil-C5-methylase (TrmA/RlmC/RlmD family)